MTKQTNNRYRPSKYAACAVFCGLMLMGCTSGGYKSASLRPDLILVGRITSVSEAEYMIGDVGVEAKLAAPDLSYISPRNAQLYRDEEAETETSRGLVV